MCCKNVPITLPLIPSTIPSPRQTRHFFYVHHPRAIETTRPHRILIFALSADNNFSFKRPHILRSRTASKPSATSLQEMASASMSPSEHLSYSHKAWESSRFSDPEGFVGSTNFNHLALIATNRNCWEVPNTSQLVSLM